MTKEEAIQLLKNGNKLTHDYFSEHEYIFQFGNKMFMEDGASIDMKTFWSDRTGSSWDNGWEIYTITSKQ